MMTSGDVLQILACLQDTGIRVWVDGGWGVDALIGTQTRPHDDLDVVITLSDAPAVEAVLAELGFIVIDDERPTRFVARDAQDRHVDFHTIVFDDEGGGIQHLQDGSSWRYPPEGFAGKGHITNCPVACLTAAVQVLCHCGYDPDDTDRHDMKLLADHFGLTLPSQYEGDPTLPSG